MLTYTFTTREKVMLGLLALVGVVIVWYQLVYVNVQSQLTTLDGEIASLQDEATMNTARMTELKKMQDAIAGFEGKGYKSVTLPAYDNTQNLMAYLNGVLASAQSYNMSFENAELSEEDGTVHRAGIIKFNTTSYAEARSIAEAIARGPYPCDIDGLSIVDNKTQSKSTSNDDAFSTSLSITFFEKPSANMKTSTDESTAVEGQDLSKLSDWNS